MYTAYCTTIIQQSTFKLCVWGPLDYLDWNTPPVGSGHPITFQTTRPESTPNQPASWRDAWIFKERFSLSAKHMRVSPAVNARTSQKKEHDVNFSSPFCCWQPAVGKFAKFSRHGKLLRRYTTLGTILFGETSSYVSACGTIDHLGTQGCMMRFCKSEKDSGFRPDSASLPRQPRRSPALRFCWDGLVLGSCTWQNWHISPFLHPMSLWK